MAAREPLSYPWHDPPADLRPEHVLVGRMSYEAYRQLAETHELGLEYVDGVAYAVQTGNIRHATIATNVLRRVLGPADASGCRVFSMSVSVRTPRRNEYIPDLFVDCARPTRDDLDDHASETPCLIVEVVSPSTAFVDLEAKRPAYLEIPTLGAYLAVETDWRAVHRWWRTESGAWARGLVTGDGAVPLPCPVGVTLTLGDVYAGLQVPAEPPAPRIPHLRRVREPEPV